MTIESLLITEKQIVVGVWTPVIRARTNYEFAFMKTLCTKPGAMRAKRDLYFATFYYSPQEESNWNYFAHDIQVNYLGNDKIELLWKLFGWESYDETRALY